MSETAQQIYDRVVGEIEVSMIENGWDRNDPQFEQTLEDVATSVAVAEIGG